MRAPDGDWIPTEDIDGPSLLFRDASPFREHRLDYSDSYCYHGRSAYCLTERNLGGKRETSGATHMECHMWPGREAAPGKCGTPGRPTVRSETGIKPEPRGYEKLALPRGVRRMTKRS